MIKTIKVKKEFTFRELLQWIIENDVSGRDFMSKDKTSRFIIDESGNFHFGISVHGNQTYEINVEKEITESTYLDHLIEVTKGDLIHTYQHDVTINEVLDEDSKVFYTLIDGELIRIWEREQ